MSKLDTSRGRATGKFSEEPENSGEMPRAIGRYTVISRLGAGGFGAVYLARDEQLGRLVAIKVPHPGRLTDAEDAELYLREARTVARLDHPNIVPVFDVGSTPECPFFVVSKHIEGGNLAERLRRSPFSIADAADLIATMAECLHYAHRQRLVHRDVKPGNILLDTAGKPFLADFGLALVEQDPATDGGYVGTPAYMSPEQARGEGHRVDGRSDVFSLGIVFYELLTGRRPFRGETRSLLAERITSQDPKPPRQMADGVTKELERICLRALAKRATDRYTTAQDFADDLRCYLRTGPSASLIGGAPTDSANRLPSPLTPSAAQAIRIIPKGLRSFDEHDADFFLDLLPGPRDRNGLPESIRFWKARVEGTAGETSFSVGLIYGPSGCGKSSLVKAGLLPRLADFVTPVYVEATAADTEQRLLSGLRSRCPAAPNDRPLTETLAALRRGSPRPGSAGRPAPGKVLIVLDQFEQWLHARKDADGELVQALRQCDGEHVQCLVLVRDDFYAAVNRFFGRLEVPIQEGRNYTLVDLFDSAHARKVLAAFGRAYGRLPEPPDRPSAAEQTFLDRAVEGLAQGGRVISVRLALFAEMMKGRPWTATSLSEVGGTEGVGVTFLEETFSAQTAPPTHRVHEPAARAVLQALLPEAGTDIRGQMQPADRLLAVSGYADRPHEFKTLLGILETEVRLIAPTEPAHAPRPSASGIPDETFFQLTHDFLVPAVREWLTRKQRETPAGRAQLLLAERAALWSAKTEAKQLPSFGEWLTVLRRTRRANWSEPQRRMMRAANRRHASSMLGGVAAVTLAVLIVVLLIGQFQQHKQRNEADHLVGRLLMADVDRVGEVAGQLEGLPPGLWRPRLEQTAGDENRADSERLRAHLALVSSSSDSVPFLTRRILQGDPGDVGVIMRALAPHADRCRETFWVVAADADRPAEERLRAAAALADFDPDGDRWDTIAAATAAALVREHPLAASEWTRLLRPARKRLTPSLMAEFSSGGAEEWVRMLAAGILADYGADNPELLVAAMQEAGDRQIPILLPAVKAQAGRCAELFQIVLDTPAGQALGDVRARTRHRAIAAVALFMLGRPEAVRDWLGRSDDPDLRTALIDLLPVFIEFDALWPLSRSQSGELTRQAVLMAAEVYQSKGKQSKGRLSSDVRRRLEAELPEIFIHDESAAVHSAAEWLLRRLGRSDQLNELTAGLAGKAPAAGKPLPAWWVTPEGHTLVLIRGPAELRIGAEDRARPGGAVRSGHFYAIATHEVTVEQFQKLFPKHDYDQNVSPTPDCAASKISWLDAIRYCWKLSKVEGIHKDEIVYPEINETDAERFYSPRGQPLTLPADWQRRTGYRLPTEVEWEFACRAGTKTPRFFGTHDEALSKYGWWGGNSGHRLWPVGSLRPNPFGLFDVYGNAGEWCADGDPADPTFIRPERHEISRGGTFKDDPMAISSGAHDSANNGYGWSNTGFRIVRTIRPDAPPERPNGEDTWKRGK